jgi:L-lactate dehydrogenase complex protein LldE
MRFLDIFIPCAVDQFRPGIGLSMVTLFEKAGLTPQFRREQGCCGGIPFQAGHWNEARTLGINLLKTFNGAQRIVTPSADCAIMVTRHYHELFFNTAYHLEFKSVSEAIFEFCDYWVNELENPELGFRFNAAVVIHPSCGLGNEYMQGRELELIIRNIQGIDLIDLPQHYHSCGAGGLLSWNFPEASKGIGNQFLDEVLKTRAQIIVVNEPSCAVNLSRLIEDRKLTIKALHITELMALSLQNDQSHSEIL